MTDRTRVELVNQALEELKLKPAGQDADAEDYDTVNDRVPAMFAELLRESVVAVLNYESQIPEEIFEILALLLAARCTGTFGGVRDRSVEMSLKNDIRRVLADAPSYAPQVPDYF